MAFAKLASTTLSHGEFGSGKTNHQCFCLCLCFDIIQRCDSRQYPTHAHSLISPSILYPLLVWFFFQYSGGVTLTFHLYPLSHHHPDMECGVLYGIRSTHMPLPRRATREKPRSLAWWWRWPLWVISCTQCRRLRRHITTSTTHSPAFIDRTISTNVSHASSRSLTPRPHTHCVRLVVFSASHTHFCCMHIFDTQQKGIASHTYTHIRINIHNFSTFYAAIAKHIWKGSVLFDGYKYT